MTDATTLHPGPQATVLVVDEDRTVLDLLTATLRFEGFAVHTAATGPAAVEVASRVRPDLVICEVALPGVNGYEVLRGLRGAGIDAPVVFLTARTALKDKVTGLTAGGEDYITKPFSVEEVLTRVRTILRRTRTRTRIGAHPAPRGSRLRFADIALDEDAHEVWKAGEPVALSPTEFKLLHYFMTHANTALCKPMILDHVWPYDFTGDLRIVETYVSYLRRKIDTGDTALLHTLRGVGYVLREPRRG